MGLKAGIDLGTTNSCVYVLLGDEWVVVRDKNNRPTVPSAVWKHKGKLMVGNSAKAYVGPSPGPILEVKRHMGTETKVELDGEQKTAVEVSAIILRHLKDATNAFLKKEYEETRKEKYADWATPITDVVITHPAYFSSAARTATAEAGKLAGFETVTLLPEPIAAALAYAHRAGVTAGNTGDRKILVYDLGGGTFDVTVLERRAADGVVEVLNYGGDSWLGGSNFDLRLAEYLRKQLVKDRYALDGLDSNKPEDAILIQTLKSEAETIKMNLTSRDPVVLAKQNFMRDKDDQPVDLNITISREEFNELTKDLMDRTMSATHWVLAKQSFADGQRFKEDQELNQWVEEQVRKAEVDDRRLSEEEREELKNELLRSRSRANAPFCDVIMVGSSCWMPVVKERLKAELDKEAQLEAPDVIVAEGAAIKAAASGPEAILIPTTDHHIFVSLSCPPVTDRARRFPILGELTGDALVCTVTLSNKKDEDKKEERRLEKRRSFLFQRDLSVGESNEFVLRVTNPANEEILKHTISILHDPNFQKLDIGRETLAIPIKVQTRSDFETLFAENSKLPVKGEIKLLTPNDSGILRIPFYEGDTYLDEIKIDNAPKQKGVSFVLRAEMDQKYKVKAEAVMEDNEKPPSVEFEIRPRKVRTIDEIQEDLDRLKRQLEDRLAGVKSEDKKLKFLGSRRQLEREIERELQSLRPELGHVEDLAAQFRKLVEEAGMVRQLTPSYDDLKAEFEPRRRYAPNSADVETLNQLLRDAEKVWEAQDEDEWNVRVKQCRELTRTWEPPPPPPSTGDRTPPPPAEVRQIGLNGLEGMRKEVERWPDDVAQERDALLAEIEATKSKVRSAPEIAIYSLHVTEVVPLYERVQAGPPRTKQITPDLADSASKTTR
jgi:molecular chaperone DnaK (HSP70)